MIPQMQVNSTNAGPFHTYRVAASTHTCYHADYLIKNYMYYVDKTLREQKGDIPITPAWEVEV